MHSAEDLNVHLSNVLADLRQAIDASIEIKNSDRRKAKEVAAVWENFLGDFIGYVKEKGQSSGQNLIADISFINIWRK